VTEQLPIRISLMGLILLARFLVKWS